eukprot:scaffold211702_cov27-Tisochrysis_lutea.AAC.4
MASDPPSFSACRRASAPWASKRRRVVDDVLVASRPTAASSGGGTGTKRAAVSSGACAYPVKACGLSTNISPRQPRGTGTRVWGSSKAKATPAGASPAGAIRCSEEGSGRSIEMAREEDSARPSPRSRVEYAVSHASHDE